MSTQTHGPGNENPSHAGPEGESAGEPSENLPSTKPERKERLKPIPGPGAPMVPDHQNIDSNPIDPRVF